MSKRFGGGSTAVKKTKHTQKLSPKDGNLPEWIKTAPNFRFGLKSDLAKRENPCIGQIINNDYLKEFLQRQIAKKAMEEVKRKTSIKKHHRSRIMKLRSNSVT